MRLGIIALIVLGCRTDSEPKTNTEPVVVDADSDGFSVEDGDCNDTDPLISPTMTDDCDRLSHASSNLKYLRHLHAPPNTKTRQVGR